MRSKQKSAKVLDLLFCVWFCVGCCSQTINTVVCNVGRLRKTSEELSDIQVVPPAQNEIEAVLWRLSRPEIGYLDGSELLMSGTLCQIIGVFREKRTKTDDKQKEARTIVRMASDSNIGKVLLVESVYYGGQYNLFETRMTMFSRQGMYYYMVFDCRFSYGIYPVWGVSYDGRIGIIARTWNNGNNVYEISIDDDHVVKNAELGS